MGHTCRTRLSTAIQSSPVDILETLNTKAKKLTETFRIKNLHTPSLLNELLLLRTSSRRNLLFKVQISTNLSVTQHNFIYKAAQVWNKIIPSVINSPELDIGSGVVILGSSVKSDLTTPIPLY